MLGNRAVVRAFATFVPFLLPLHALYAPGLHGGTTGAGVEVQGSSLDDRARPQRPRLAPYRGLAAWIDMYNHGPWEHPARAVRRMHRRGVTTLFLQTANYGARQAIFRPTATGEFLREAHRRDMYVVAWYVPSFADPTRDWNRTIAAVRFKSDGHRFDSFAMDIEATSVGNIGLRNRRLAHLSRRLRATVGRSYALGAIVPDVGSRYWPRFPYARMGRLYDVFLPMAYYTFRTSGYRGVLANTRANLRRIRVRTGDRGKPVHLIGGLAGATSLSEVRAFVRGVRKFGAIGASLYDYPITDAGEWEQLQGVTGRLPARPAGAAGEKEAERSRPPGDRKAKDAPSARRDGERARRSRGNDRTGAGNGRAGRGR